MSIDINKWGNYKKDKNVKIDIELWSNFEYRDILYIISQAFREYREKHNLSQKQLAEKIGMKQPMLSKMESGEYNPSIKFLVKAWNILSTAEENFGAKLIGKIYDKVGQNYYYSSSARFDVEEINKQTKKEEIIVVEKKYNIKTKMLDAIDIPTDINKAA